MGLSNAEKQREYRRRLVEQGHKRVCFHASPETMVALEALRVGGRTTDEAIRDALRLALERQRTEPAGGPG